MTNDLFAKNVSRRTLLVGAGLTGAALALPAGPARAGVARPVPALLLGGDAIAHDAAFWQVLGVTVLAALTVDTLRYMGWWPGSTSEIDAHHDEKVAELRTDGWQTRELHNGAYAGGSGHPFKLSDAQRGNEYQTLSSTRHGERKCTLPAQRTDVVSKYLICEALNKHGLTPRQITAASLPIHDGGEGFCSTPTGTIGWKARGFDTNRPTVVADIRSPILDTRIEFFTEGSMTEWGHRFG